jgi:hypothetical protein
MLAAAKTLKVRMACLEGVSSTEVQPVQEFGWRSTTHNAP